RALAGVPGQRLPGKPDLPAARRHEADDAARQRALARSGFADDGGDRARRQVDADTVEHLVRPVDRLDVADAQDRLAGAVGPGPLRVVAPAGPHQLPGVGL